MKHHIIVKYNDTVTDKKTLAAEIRALFAEAADIPGVHGAEIHENCIARENRYDIMIVVNMDREALPVWDDSALHKRWKSEYGGIVGLKAIFDCD